MIALQCTLLSYCHLFDVSMDDHEMCDKLMEKLTKHLLNDNFKEAKKCLLPNYMKTKHLMLIYNT